MRLSEEIPFKTSANPQARGQKINHQNIYENVKLFRRISYFVPFVPGTG